MSTPTLHDLQASVQDRNAFKKIEDYFLLAQAFLKLLTVDKPTRIVSPSTPAYVDPRPEMSINERLKAQIADFERFIVHDLWNLSK